MGYVKTIEYGDIIEIFSYENNLRPHKKKIKNKDKPEITDEERYENKQKNAYRAKKDFIMLVKANLDDKSKPLFISFTYAELMEDISKGFSDFRKFIQSLRYKYGKKFRYIAVLELQKRGAVHFHSFFWDLPLEINPKSERKKRTLANIWGHGFVDVKDSDGNDGLFFYLVKYMAKTFADKNLKNKKAYIASRNIRRPFVDKNTMINYALFGKVGEDDKPEIDKTYHTQWLGKCRHLLFKIKK